MYNNFGDYMLMICYKKCSTCQKAKKYLDSLGIHYIERNIEDGITKEELKKWIPLSNKDIHKFFNTSGLIYKNENYKEKLKTMSYEEKLDALEKNPMLIKRPILVDENFVLVGFKEIEYNTINR